jgi:UDP-N-acetylmuramoylalanine--D-glutamate ligase
VRYQKSDDILVVNCDYKTPLEFEKETAGHVYYFSRKKGVKGAYIHDRWLKINIDSPLEILKLNKLQLRGEHNWENVLAAVCTTYLAGIKPAAIRSAAYNFAGLEHRLEYVGEVDGRLYYNDSFATGPQPTIAAIKSFSEPTTLILGGYDKGLDYDSLIKEIVVLGRRLKILLIGDLKDKLKVLLLKSGFKGDIYDMKTSSMGKIVRKAKNVTVRGGVVLLSPAAASFDMYDNYKQRGSLFKKEVKKLFKG